MHGHVFASGGNYLDEDISVTLPARRARARTHSRTYFAILSALATKKEASPIGLIAVLGCLLFAPFTATQ